MMTVTAVIAGMAAGQAASASPRHHLREGAGGEVISVPADLRPVHSLVPKLYAPKWSGEIDIKKPTVPFYKDRFTYQGKTYPYTSMGTDPRTSSVTTHIPVVFIPIRIFVPGASTWPTGAIKQTTSSALFTNSVITGNTQYGDATLRSGYWSDVKAHSGKWHVLFDKPTVRPLLRLHVPSGKGTWTGPDGAGHVVLLVNTTWYRNALFKIAATVPATSLAVFLTFNTVGCGDIHAQATCGVGGIHGWTSDMNGTHVFAWASWTDPTVFVSHMATTAWPSSVLVNTLNNPFANDVVPNWSSPSQPRAGCMNQFAPSLPVLGTVFSANGLEYQDTADLSWFARQKPSIGFQGRYSYLGTLTKLPTSC
jgi:hypothetical protein